MTLSIRTRPYEVVVRIDATGAAHCHVGRIQEVIDESGAVQPGMSRELPVEPIDLAGPEFGPLVAALDAEIIAANTRLQSRIADLEAQLASQKPAAE